MKIKITCIGVFVFLYPFFHVLAAQAETLPPIVLSEIQVTGASGHSNDDFVELYNPHATSIDISGYRLRYKNSSATSSSQSLREIPDNTCIQSHGYYLWANSNGIFAKSADTKTGTSLSSNYSLALFVPQSLGETIIDSVSWGSGSHPFDSSAFIFADNPGANQSMVRNLTTGDWLSSFSSTPTPTKSTNTACPLPPSPPAIVYDADVRLNEILANPSSDESTDEFIELYNTSDKAFDLTAWTIKDASASGKYIFPAGTEIQAKDFLVVYRTAFKFALNNSDETVFLLDPDSVEKDTASYKTSKENVSWNYAANGWHGGTPTPGAVNQLNTLPETKEKVPKKGYHGAAVDFDAQGKDSDHDTLKYAWDFGDGHKSYKEKTSHTYEENGTYTVTLTTNDGKDDIVETFTLKIESFPRLKVRITSLLANPEGSDTDNEWIIIANQEKKTINLKDYSIATGWKKLSNHPIRENFFIGPKAEVKLTRQFSLFTLPNQKGKVELRAPDGKVLQDIKYKFDKPIAENAVYQKKKNTPWMLAASAPKNILLPPPAENIETNATPTEEIAPPTPEEKIIPLQDQLTINPERPELQDILAYGTRVHLPDTITLTPPPVQEIAPFSETEQISLSLAERIASQINTSLNGLLSSTSEQ